MTPETQRFSYMAQLEAFIKQHGHKTLNCGSYIVCAIAWYDLEKETGGHDLFIIQNYKEAREALGH